jgi:hypothetical protein
MAYKRVDLRDKLPGQPWSNINGLERERKGSVPQKKPGRIVIHYSDQDFEGEDIYDRLRHGKTSVLQVLASEARGHMSQPRLDPTFRTNGIQYHYSVWRDMVFQCRNEEALLWHCNDGIGADSYNYTAIAVHVPTTKGFPASRQTVQTLTGFVADKLKEHGTTSRSNVKGHQELSATECPGPLMNQFVLPFRTGNLNPGEDPGGQIGGDHSDIPVDGNMSRWEFGQVDVERLKITIAIQYDGHHTWDFKPTTADRPGVPNWSRRQFMQARIQDIPSDLDVTFAGEKFGEIREVDQPPDTDGVPDWVRRPLAFLEAAKGGKYTAWKEAMGKFADGPPAWVSNAKPPPAAAVKSKGGFCASLPNLACRVNDVDIFVDSAKWWAGGVPWWGERVLNKKVARKFVLNRKYPPGTLFLRRFTGSALAKQGHVAILLRGRTLIQSDLQLGINSSRTLESTHNSLGKFEYYILPEDWLKPAG